ncbi:hypothetical protein [Actinoplanes sp. GCM10030250]|uniref:hypothetical protein n=1 Tax=Actinoplanes sp. GCM10030250 TaxID=3273376 RepID=UPI00362080EB
MTNADAPRHSKSLISIPIDRDGHQILDVLCENLQVDQDTAIWTALCAAANITLYSPQGAQAVVQLAGERAAAEAVGRQRRSWAIGVSVLLTVVFGIGFFLGHLLW